MGESNEFWGTHKKAWCVCVCGVHPPARPAAKVFVIQEGCGSASDLLLVLFSDCVKGPCALYLVLMWTAERQRDGSAGDESLSPQLAQDPIPWNMLPLPWQNSIFRCHYKTHTHASCSSSLLCVFIRSDGRKTERREDSWNWKFYFPHTTFETGFSQEVPDLNLKCLPHLELFMQPGAESGCRVRFHKASQSCDKSLKQVTHAQKTQTTQNGTTLPCVISLFPHHWTTLGAKVKRTWC